jgi:CRP/FNR family nitrogen fixation transcriptional regulator
MTYARQTEPLATKWRPLKSLEGIMTITSYHRGQSLYNQSDPAQYWYCVGAGMAKKYALLEDGRQQIVDFLLPGDFFGFGVQNAHQFTVEVVVNDTILACYPRQETDFFAAREPQLAQLMRDIAFDTISRSQARMIVLGRTTAAQKVGAFLVEMANRLPGGSEGEVHLPMSRYDIGDYLGLSFETVSRALTYLRCRGHITFVSARTIRIVGLAALKFENT